MLKRFLIKMLGSFEVIAQHSNSIETSRRLYLLFFISVIGVLNLIPLGILAKFQNNTLLFIADFIVAAILILNLVIVYFRKRYEANIYIGVLITGILYIFLFITGGVEQSAFVWYFTFPLVASYLLGSFRGAVMAVLIMVPVLITWIFPLPPPVFVTYSTNFLIRFVFAYTVVLLFSYLFENSRERSRDELSGIHNTLEDRVKQRTEELSKINKQLKKEVGERKKAEDALRTSEKNYRLITESTSDLIAVTSFSAKPVYKYVSPSHTQLGYSREDMIGKSGFEFIYPADKKKLLRILKNYTGRKIKNVLTNSDTEFGISLEYRVYDKNGDVQFLQSTVNVIERELLFISKVVTDQKTAEKEKIRLQEKMIYSEKMESLGQLAGGVAHDLNNVLGGIVGYPDLILRKLPEESDLRGNVEAIKRSGQRAAAMIGDLLGLVQRRVLVTTSVNLNDIVTEYFNSPEFQKLSSFHPEVNFLTDLNPELKMIEGSHIHLTKSLMNLVSNAAEAMPSGGHINVKTANKIVKSSIKGFLKDIEPGMYVLLKITDAGIGISRGAIKKIFEPFYTKKNLKRSGTGLGMSVVLGTVIDHNADLVVKSTKKKGSSFTLYFSVSEEKGVLSQEINKSIDYSGNGELILVVDDDPEQRKLLSTLLNTLGYHVELCPSGEEALKFIKKKSPDLVVLDMIMNPGMDGLETFLEMRNIDPGIKVVLASGYSDKNRIKRAFISGIIDYIQKPFTLKQIGKAINQALNVEKLK